MLEVLEKNRKVAKAKGKEKVVEGKDVKLALYISNLVFGKFYG